jgi:ParB family chromosome partitioning protein
MACTVFGFRGDESSLQLSAKVTRFREAPTGAIMLDAVHQDWLQRIPSNSLTLWNWCLEQDQSTVLELLAYCVSRSVDGVQRKADHPQNQRLVHAHALATALNLDVAEWFAPTAANFFSRISRATILSSLAEATGAPAKRSWDKLKKRELAALAEREIAGKGWLPKPLRASA